MSWKLSDLFLVKVMGTAQSDFGQALPHIRSSATDPTQFPLRTIEKTRKMTLESWQLTWGVGIGNVRMKAVVDVPGSTPSLAILRLSSAVGVSWNEAW